MAEQKSTISPEGRAQAEAELKHRIEVRRPEIVQAIKVAREFGDLKENAEYHAAREEQGMNEARIRVLEHHLANAEVGESAGDGSAQVGSRVSFREAGTEATKQVTLVHPLEAAMADGKISVESPIGSALLGARSGAVVELSTPGGVKQLEVLEVS